MRFKRNKPHRIFYKNIMKENSPFYNPSRNNSIDNYFNSLSNLLIDFDFFTICGDLNINLLTNDHKSVELKNHFASADFSLVNLHVSEIRSNRLF